MGPTEFKQIPFAGQILLSFIYHYGEMYSTQWIHKYIRYTHRLSIGMISIQCGIFKYLSNT